MLIKNCQIIYLDRIEKGTVWIEDGKIKAIDPICDIEQMDEVYDANGLYLAPGFIDVHIHGAGGCDTMDGTKEALCMMAKTIAKYGTTAFVPTTMTCRISEIRQALKAVQELQRKKSDGAQVLGAHLEGPFVSGAALGAQNPKYLLKPSMANYQSIVEGYEDTMQEKLLICKEEGGHLLRWPFL